MKELVAMVAALRAEPGLELEARLGVATDVGFQPGIGAERAVAILARMGTNPALRFSDLREHRDFFHDGLRTRVTYDSDKLEIGAMTVRKETVTTCLLPGARISLARETDAAPPGATVPTFVRIQQRRAAEWKGTWRYELSNVWSGPGAHEAEAARHSQEPRIEMEIELISPSYVATHSDEHIAESIACKVNDMLL